MRPPSVVVGWAGRPKAAAMGQAGHRLFTSVPVVVRPDVAVSSPAVAASLQPLSFEAFEMRSCHGIGWANRRLTTGLAGMAAVAALPGLAVAHGTTTGVRTIRATTGATAVAATTTPIQRVVVIFQRTSRLTTTSGPTPTPPTPRANRFGPSITHRTSTRESSPPPRRRTRACATLFTQWVRRWAGPAGQLPTAPPTGARTTTSPTSRHSSTTQLLESPGLPGRSPCLFRPYR